MEDFLLSLRQGVGVRGEHLLPLFDVMAGEARFARAWLDDDLKVLPRAAPILELGGGVFILACQLAREGFAVTAVEPLGAGFGVFGELGAAVLEFAAREGPSPVVVRCKAEEFSSDARFAFAFSVNVMEHVESPEKAIARQSAILSPGSSYRFICPNYLFPYEPHFNILTFGSKALTQRILWRRIRDNARMEDPAGVWRSLNWITVPRVKRMAASDTSLAISFRTSTLPWILERAVSDAGFARRRAPWMVAVLGALGRLGLLRLATLIPATFQPIMDVRLTKRP